MALLAMVGDEGDELGHGVAGGWVSEGRTWMAPTAPGADRVPLVEGTTTGDLPLSAIGRGWLGPSDSRFGEAVSIGHDVTADGYAELVVTGTLDDGDAGAAWIFEGVPDAWEDADEVAVAKLLGIDGSRLGSGVASLGDTDGDGVDELAVADGLAGEDELYGRVYVWTAVTAGVSSADDADSSIVGDLSFSDESGFGTSMAPAGDVDGDGHDDVWLNAWTLHGDYVRQALRAAWLIHGPLPEGTWGVGTVCSSWVVSSWPHGGRGYELGSADLDQDGHADLALSSPGHGLKNEGAWWGPGHAYVYWGPNEGRITWGDYGVEVTGPDDGLLGTGLATGDYDGDGWPDLALGAPGGESAGVYLLGGAFLP
ncbi:MAG: hypothetical protein GY884_07520 [Proteobacteria bacterium]|nr:hypothetical protein [Pseudomonadota bacterium]